MPEWYVYDCLRSHLDLWDVYENTDIFLLNDHIWKFQTESAISPKLRFIEGEIFFLKFQ